MDQELEKGIDIRFKTLEAESKELREKVEELGRRLNAEADVSATSYRCLDEKLEKEIRESAHLTEKVGALENWAKLYGDDNIRRAGETHKNECRCVELERGLREVEGKLAEHFLGWTFEGPDTMDIRDQTKWSHPEWAERVRGGSDAPNSADAEDEVSENDSVASSGASDGSEGAGVRVGKDVQEVSPPVTPSDRERIDGFGRYDAALWGLKNRTVHFGDQTQTAWDIEAYVDNLKSRLRVIEQWHYGVSTPDELQSEADTPTEPRGKCPWCGSTGDHVGDCPFAEIDHLKQQLAEAREEVEGLKVRLDVALYNHKRSREDWIEALYERNAQKSRADRLDAYSKQADAEIEKLRTDLATEEEERQNDIAEKVEEIDRLTGENRLITSNSADAHREIVRLKREAERLNATVREYHTAKLEAEQTIASLRGELADAPCAHRTTHPVAKNGRVDTVTSDCGKCPSCRERARAAQEDGDGKDMV